MVIKFLIQFLSLLLCGCTQWDSTDFTPRAEEIILAAKVGILKLNDQVDLFACSKIGDLKILSSEGAGHIAVVATRKYKNASIVKYTGSGTDGGFFGEAPTNYYDVYNCPKDKTK